MGDRETPKKKTEEVAKGEDRVTYSARTESGSMDEPKGRNSDLGPSESDDRTDGRPERDSRSREEKRDNATQMRNELGQSSGYPVPPPVAEDCRHYLQTGQCRFGEHCRYNHPSERNHMSHEMVQRSLYPVRPDVQDREHYIRTGQRSFGSNCRFNYPPTHLAMGQWSGYPVRPPVEEDCWEYLRTGQCIHGKRCKYNHPSLHGMVQTSLYPVRPGVPDCGYYIRTGRCSFGRNCRFNHPPTHLAPLPLRHEMGQTILYPVRPGVPDCGYYIRTGVCIHGSNCIFNHPPTHLAPYFLGGYCTLGSDTHTMRGATTSYKRVDKRRQKTESSSRGAKRMFDDGDHFNLVEKIVGILFCILVIACHFVALNPKFE